MAWYRASGNIPDGKIEITTTAETDVTDYATAQVVDSDLVAANIKSGVDILGVTGTASTIDTVSSVPSTKSTDIIYNSSDSSYYIWWFPTKGRLISMNIDGTSKQYRVLNVNGTIVEVVAMTNISDSVMFDENMESCDYAGSTLDTYLNTTYYATLTSTVKTAIVDKTFTQDSWYDSDAGTPSYNGYSGTTKPGSDAYTISLNNTSYGSSITRHIYALSVQDVLDFILDSTIPIYTDGTLQNYNIWKMFWNDEVQHATLANYPWLRSAAGYSVSTLSKVWSITGSTGSIDSGESGTSQGVRPAFCIDLSQISWSFAD